MSILKELITINQHLNTPVYLQISNAFIQNIRLGRLRRGLRLPGSREVASLLNINRMTMVAAYDELQAQGWIQVKPRKGTFVKEDLPELNPKRIRSGTGEFTIPDTPGFPFDEKRIIPIETSDFPKPGMIIINDGFPDPRLAPIENLTRCMRSLSKLATHRKYLMYGGTSGTELFRETLARFLSDTRGLPISKDNVLSTRGAQMGIYLACRVIAKPGDDIIVGEPGYIGANLTFLQLGLKVNRIPVDTDGLDVDLVEKACKKKKIKLVYVIPHHHHPTTVTLTPERRIRLLDLAIKYKFAIIEDDYDYDFHYASKPIMPMASLDRNGSVIYIGTLTKTFAPSVRIGFMIAPQKFIRFATYIRKAVDTQGDSLLENAIAELYKEGVISRHIKKSVKIYKERRDHFCQLLRSQLGEKISFKIPDGGMSVWTAFPGTNLEKVSSKAFEMGLIIKDGTEFDIGSIKYNSVRMGFASLNLDEQTKAMGILKSVL